MEIGNIWTQVANDSDLESLVFEIATGPYTFASMSIEDGEIVVGFYSNPWQVDHHVTLKEFEEVLQMGKEIMMEIQRGKTKGEGG